MNIGMGKRLNRCNRFCVTFFETHRDIVEEKST
jgi:hypothetical protein